ncbi:MAG: LysM peptidoglycan-binding domain-containing protein [Anaerolineae bacterium]|nr:LysM peptidoglycan-binding domain-containing protein [Anaerolineae bacterium]
MNASKRTITIVVAFSLTLGYLILMVNPVWAAPGYGVYVVQPGDTLYGIARRYHTDVATLQRLNHLTNPNWIRAGQRLVVPGQGRDGPAATVRPRVIILPPSAARSTPVPDGGASCLYRVQRGDTLFGLARRFQLPHTAIASANGISASSMLYVGQILRIPRADCGFALVGEATGRSTSALTADWYASATPDGAVFRSATPALTSPRRLLPTPTPTPNLRHRFYGFRLFPDR